MDESRRLTRPQEGRIVAGVCAGVARYFDIDPVILRVILAVLAIFGGAGVVIYGAGWLLIPETGAADTRLEHWIAGRHGDRRRNIIIVAIAAFVLFFVVRHNPFAYRISGAVVLVIVVMSAAALLGRWRTEHGDGWRAEHSSTFARSTTRRPTSRIRCRQPRLTRQCIGLRFRFRSDHIRGSAGSSSALP